MSARVAVSQHSASALSLLSRSLPPVPPPVIPSSDPECCRDKEDEIYITSASVIELDSRKSTDNDSYDSGIYNASTHTGWSSCSDKSAPRHRRLLPGSQVTGNTFLKVVSDTEEGAGYEEQVISVWLDMDNESDYSSGDEEESVYETLSDSVCNISVNPPSDLDLLRPDDSNLSKIAEAAGRGIKKLRRNWSIKKDDLSKGLSKIKRSSRNLIEDVYTKEAKFSSVGRRKLSMSQLLSTADNCQTPEVQGSNFYIGLTEPSAAAFPCQPGNKPGQFSRSSSVLSDISECDIMTDFSPPPSLSLISSPPPSLPPSVSSTTIPVRPRRRSGKGGKSVTRPSDPPPPPPINLDTHPLNTPSPPSALATLAAEICDSVRDMTGELISDGHELEETGETIYFSRLMPNEPLYQFYETLPLPPSLCPGPGQDDGTTSGQPGPDCQDPQTPPARTKPSTQPRFPSVDMSGPGSGVMVSQSGQRSLWCDMPQVTSSSLLSAVSPQIRRLQEAKFEIISSEASYLRSLNVLVSQFANSTKLRHNAQVISSEDWAAVFSNIYQIRECSEKFLQNLETCWQRSVMMHGLSEILLGAARSEFDVFIDYCSNQAVQERTLKRLRNVNTNFAMVLQDLESSQACQSLSLHSFLMLPMQRITRLPLLTAAILSHCGDHGDVGEGEHQDLLVSEVAAYRECLKALNTLVTKCNEGARHRDRQDQLVKINQTLDFKQVPWLYLVTPTRWLVRQTTVTRLCWRESQEKITWGRRVSKVRIHLLLFTDLLLVCKKKRDEKMQVLDYCPKNMLDLSAVELSSSTSTLGMGALINSVSGSGVGGVKSAAWLTLIQNSGKKTCEMIILFDGPKERTAWLELIQPAQEGGEKIYETWDCPSVEILQNYETKEEGDKGVLRLEAGDAANILRKSGEGLVLIQRTADGARGWVPGAIVKEVHSDHMRARNFKQRYQFLKALAELDMADT